MLRVSLTIRQRRLKRTKWYPRQSNHHKLCHKYTAHSEQDERVAGSG